MSKAAELANLIGNINAGSPLANKNLVQNGAMLVNQRGSSAITLSGLTPHIDRFTAYKANDGTQTVQQSTDGPEGFKNSLLVTNTGADSPVAAANRVAILHRMEGQDVAHLEFGTSSAKTITLSFWVKSSITGTHGGSFGNGANNRAYPFTYTISSSDTWEHKTITAAGDTTGTWATDNTTGLQVAWGLGVGTTNSGTAGSWESADRNSATGATTGFLTTANATWYLTGVQLEIGQNETPFEHEPFGRTYEKCERYYQKSYIHTEKPGGSSNAGTGTYLGSSYVQSIYNTTYNQQLYYMQPFRTKMRAAPTINSYNVYLGTEDGLMHYASGTNHGASFSYQSENSFRFYGSSLSSTGNNNGGDGYAFHWVADAEL